MSVCVICESSPSGTMCAYHSGYKQGHAAGQALGATKERELIVAHISWLASFWKPAAKSAAEAIIRNIQSGDHIASGAHEAGADGVKPK